MYLIFFTSFISTQLNGVFLFNVVALADMWRWRRWSSPSAERRSSRCPTPDQSCSASQVLSWIGVVSVAVLGYFSYNAFTNPAIGPSAESARLIILAVVLVPMAIYAASYYYNRSRGFDLSLITADLPPE